MKKTVSVLVLTISTSFVMAMLVFDVGHVKSETYYYNFRMSITPESPAIFEEVDLIVGFDTASISFSVFFGQFSQVGNNFFITIDIYVPDIVLPVIGYEAETYHLGRLVNGSYHFNADVQVWDKETAILLEENLFIESFFVTKPTTVPDDYPTIQDAINAASQGDTIFVRSGTYYENVVVNKTVLLIGENKTKTIIDGNGSGTVLSLTVNNVTISEFTILNHWYHYGIKVHSDNNKIVNSIITLNSYSFMLIASDNNNITSNEITNSQYGIGLGEYGGNGSCDGNLICDNLIANNSQYGIGLWSQSKSNEFARNIVEESPWGIALRNSLNNTVRDNIIRQCNSGIELMGQGCDDNLIKNNTVQYCSNGISLIDSCKRNNIIENSMSHNDLGIGLSFLCNNNIIYHNNLVGNTVQATASESAGNAWTGGYPSGGNFWSDYSGIDNFWGQDQNLKGYDMIGDTPCVINEENMDNYPLMIPWRLHKPPITEFPDLNGDGKVNIVDISTVAIHFGQEFQDP